MLIGEYFEGKHLRASDLGGAVHIVTIVGVEQGAVGQGKDKTKKAIVTFREFDKSLACNVTNGNRIADLYGPDTTKWIGKRVMVFPTETEFQGKDVPCIRVKKELPPEDAPTSPQTAAEPQDAQTPPDDAAGQADALVRYLRTLEAVTSMSEATAVLSGAMADGRINETTRGAINRAVATKLADLTAAQ